MKFLYLSIIYDYYKISFYLFFISKFFSKIPFLLMQKFLVSNKKLNILSKIILHVNFYNILFNKEKILTHFLMLEVISSQKPFFTFTKKTNNVLNIEQGFLNGAKVTLHRDNLFLFLFEMFLSFFKRHKFFDISTQTYVALNFLLNSSNFFFMYNFLKRNFFNLMFLWKNCFYNERLFFFFWNKLHPKFN